MMRLPILLIALCVLLAGCKGYTDREKELYFMDAQEMVFAYEAVFEMEPAGHGDQRRTHEIVTQKLIEFERQYTKTPVDESFDMIESLRDCESKTDDYVSINLVNLLAVKVGSNPPDSPETLAKLRTDLQESLKSAQAKIDESRD